MSIGYNRFLREFKLNKEFILFDEEVVRNLKKMKELISSMKTRFDHVRGDVESREIMIDTIDRAITIIEEKGVNSERR